MTYCGADCSECTFKSACRGCGQPFGGKCVLAECCIGKNQDSCGKCGKCTVKSGLIDEINGLHVKRLPEITELFPLPAAFVNLEYTIVGRKVKFFDDSQVILGAQLEGAGGGRCFGVAADDEYIAVSEYGEAGADPVLLTLVKRQK